MLEYLKRIEGEEEHSSPAYIIGLLIRN
jgi:hypothetical protein